MTNYELFKKFTKQELAKFLLYHRYCHDCVYRELYDCEKPRKKCLEAILEWMDRENDEQITNRERMFEMSDRRLAEFLLYFKRNCRCVYDTGGGICSHPDADCVEGTAKWLKTEAKND